MVRKLSDFGFVIILIFIIAVGAYWIMVQLQQDYLDKYLGLLGDKLITMVPESSEKESLAELYNQFKQKVETKEIAPEQVEEIAAGIFNLSLISDSISLAEARTLIEVPPKPEPRLSDSLLGQKDLIRVPEPDYKQWQALEQRLEFLYKFEDRTKYIPEIRYQVDNKLNVIIDTEVKPLLNKIENKSFIAEMKDLEEKKALIFVDNLNRDIKRKEYKLIKIRHDSLVQEHEKLSELHHIIVINADSIAAVISMQMDSLNLQIKSKVK